MYVANKCNPVISEDKDIVYKNNRFLSFHFSFLYVSSTRLSNVNIHIGKCIVENLNYLQFKTRRYIFREFVTEVCNKCCINA